MAKRANSMATIAAALASANAPTAPPQPVNAPNVPIAPYVNAPAPLTSLTADQKRAFDANRQTAMDAQSASEKSALQQAMELKAQQQAAQAEQDAFEQSAGATENAAKRIATGAKVRLGSIPTPGSLTLPLVMLLVLFALLLPVGGHTRLTWLWLVISGNASIGSAGTGTPTTPGDSSAQNPASPASPASPGGPITLPAGSVILSPFPALNGFIPLSSYTGVEGA